MKNKYVKVNLLQMFILNIILILLIFSVSAEAAIITVPEDHETIQAAINASEDGDTVQVDPGDYEENINFLGRIISLLGSPQDPSQTVILAAEDGSVVTFSRGETRETIFSGFTLTGGTGNLIDDLPHGGGIFIMESDPSIDHCIIVDNHVDYAGGGIACLASDPKISSCVLYDNISWELGGAVFVDWESSPQFYDCTITDNLSTGDGGGLVIQRGSRVLIISSILWDNEPQEVFFGEENDNVVQLLHSVVMGGEDGIEVVEVEEGRPNRVAWNPGNCTDDDPLFIDPDNNDYRPGWESFPVADEEKSPCIDSAHNISPDDPDGTSADMGALYFDQGNPSELYFDPDFINIVEPEEFVINVVAEGDRSVNWEISPDADWITVDPMSGLLYPEQDADVFIQVSAEGLDRGRYATDLRFIADNPDDRVYVVEAIFYYGGGSPPEWREIPDEIFVTEGDELIFDMEGFDPDDVEISIQITRNNLPETARFGYNGNGTARVIWQVSHFDAGEYHPEFILTDGVFSITAELPIVVEDYMQEFDLSTPADGSELRDEPMILEFAWSSASRDLDIDDITYSIHFLLTDSTSVVIESADTTILVSKELISIDHESDITVNWEVWAHDGFDSLQCTIQFEFLLPPLSIKSDNDMDFPELITLEAAYPNPFNSNISVNFFVHRFTDVNISLYGIDGKLILPLHSESYASGSHRWSVDLPEDLPSGLYLLRLRADKTMLHQRIVLLK